MKTVRVALLGAGTVGQAWVGLLPQHQDRLAALGVRLELVRVLVREAQKSRPGIPPQLLTTDPEGFLDGVEVLVEVAGGTGRVGDLVLEALSRGLPVITANKALLAERWRELRPYAERGRLYYEASVMAGTPVLGALQSLWGNQARELHGIVNGTCSYLIRRMEEGASYKEAFEEAGRLGYLEADPRLDVGGIDAAHKICVLGRLTVDPALEWAQVLKRTRGIEHLTPQALAEARQAGQAIRLVASLYPEDGAWVAAVRPVRLPLEHPLVLLGSGRNALVYRGEPIGTLYFAGAGAGGAVTASAVMDDLYRWLSGAPGHRPIPQIVPALGLEVEQLEEA
ncbi:Homoserine dehydrogenase [Meiothermus luteus]|jgi:homoserine dehydrogenase|uniref:Homoserine dehydrogenase n=1 Tax=Meiothermus luteus TaxID=2026184 RepID=A0A399EKL7_9DEIN|nr:homoserine dehydrogenase [Meiothermus luteus]RIH85274.1 Homoserine dehydrogenase [Meiothermus luteus]RMH53751.1 MAG: homoserine dehydrogenase [Deinococcota bacterium]